MISQDFSLCGLATFISKMNFHACYPFFKILLFLFLNVSLIYCLLQVVVVQAISALCQKYPRKHSVMMNFLSNMLRDDVSPSLTDHRLSSLFSSGASLRVFIT